MSFLQPFFEELSNDIYINFDKTISEKFIEDTTIDYINENTYLKSKHEFLKLIVAFASSREKVLITTLLFENAMNAAKCYWC